MRIAVAGSSGFIGSALCASLRGEGVEVRRLLRPPQDAAPDALLWDPAAGRLNPADLEGLDAVVNLAGDNLVEGRWNDEKKALIRSSRVDGTSLLARTLAGLEQPPAVFASASAVGYYGSRAGQEVREYSTQGRGFLAEVCGAWEAATRPAKEAGIRVVNLRIGVVLGAEGGAIRKMIRPFKMGVGGRIGSGEQYMSWITLEDAVGAIRHAIDDPAITGPLNVVAPHPVTNRVFTKILGKVLGRPTILPMPAFAARLVFGEMADELLLASQRVVPERLQQTKYAFQHPELEGALRHVLGRP